MLGYVVELCEPHKSQVIDSFANTLLWLGVKKAHGINRGLFVRALSIRLTAATAGLGLFLGLGGHVNLEGLFGVG